MKYLIKIILSVFLAFISCNNEKRILEANNKIQCISDCDAAKVNQEVLKGKWSISSKILAKGFKFNPTGIEVPWTIDGNGVVYNPLGQAIYSLKIVSDKHIYMNNKKCDYEISPNTFRITEYLVDGKAGVEINGERIL